MQEGSGGKSGLITDDSETFRLDKLECEVEGGHSSLPSTSAFPYRNSTAVDTSAS